MNTHLIRFETYGVKNIYNKICIDFANKALHKKECKYTKIKAIYGGNGTGKSAIADSFYIYGKTIGILDFLNQEKTYKNLSNLINKKRKEIYFKVYFAFDNNYTKKWDYYFHEIKLNERNFKYVITLERFGKVKGRSLDDSNEDLIYETKLGQLTYFKFDSLIEKVDELTRNVLSYRVLPSTMFFFDLLLTKSGKLSNNRELNEQSKKCFNLLFPFLTFSLSMNTCLVSEDNNTLNMKTYDEYLKQNNLYSEKTAVKNDNIYILETDKTDIVKKNKYNEYSKKIDRVTEFIKIFKPNLKEIKIDKKVDGKIYRCNKIFDYGDYKVDIQYESTGIKKLVELYPYIELAMQGSFVFIDELDANVNGVFLLKLLEFLDEECKGQICFTSHNLEPLNLLRKKSHAINFIGQTGKLVNWASNGNYSPRTLYLEGMIEDSPFNFDTFDFLKVFNDNEDESCN